MIRAQLDLASARALRAKQAAKWAKQIGEFAVWRPTPTREECERLAADPSDIPMIKEWDLSPMDPFSFDDTEPPGRPPAPPLPDAPVNTAPPTIAAFDGVVVGAVLAGQVGGWSGSPTYARQWTADGLDIEGETSPGLVLTVDEIGMMIGLRVVASNLGGSTTAEADPVGPVEALP
jgi:hypothetical protein